MITEAVKAKILEEATRIEDDVHCSALGHYEEASHWSRLHFLLGIPTALMAAVAGVSALIEYNNHILVAGVLAILIVILSCTSTFLRPDGKSAAHQAAGSKYTTLRNKIRMFSNLDIYTKQSEQEPIELLRALAQQRDELNEASLAISDRAYKHAHKRILKDQAAAQQAVVSRAAPVKTPSEKASTSTSAEHNNTSADEALQRKGRTAVRSSRES